jgi:two-component system chemotaxis response regulator CheB
LKLVANNIKAQFMLELMVVDDSAILRRILKSIINTSADMDAKFFAGDGLEAVEKYKTSKPDVVLMDIEMPRMNGIEALKEIISFDPNAKVIMCSTLTENGALAAIEAVEAGASGCIAKPGTTLEVKNKEEFATELAVKIRKVANLPAKAILAKPTLSHTPALEKVTIPAQAAPAEDVTLKVMPNLAQAFPSVIAIGSSTGGPRALIEMLSKLDKKISVPVFITQHIPDGFADYLAKAIQSKTAFPTHEAKDGMAVEAGHVYIAPSGMHMGCEKKREQVLIRLIDGELVNYCKPSIEVMLDSLLACYKNNILTILLTGMGSDGAKACERLVAHQGNIVLAQDKASSVVWGIPGAAAKAGLCHAVLPISIMGDTVNQLIQRKKLC